MTFLFLFASMEQFLGCLNCLNIIVICHMELCVRVSIAIYHDSYRVVGGRREGEHDKKV